MPLTRKEFITSVVLAAASTGLASEATPAQATTKLTIDDLKAVEKIAGIEFTDDELKKILAEVQSSTAGFNSVRKAPITYRTEPQTVFTPLNGKSVKGAAIKFKATPSKVKRAGLTDEDIAFLPLLDLAHLIQTTQITSTELTKIYLKRLKTYGPKLLCVITLTEDLALAQAKAADKEIGMGIYHGPLHGIPYGIKDLFATKGIHTTWGAGPYKDQIPDFDSTVVNKLRDAGAVLVAKLSMGALAMDDVWFGGKTKNPWNPKQGSSGSSAGSACSTAAGLVGFSIGTETLGSIVSPSTRCRVTGLRPTYGRTSRYGGMALSYTMDKVGPICRRAEDTAAVLAAICGSDLNDPSAIDYPFNYHADVDISKMKIGFLGARGMDTDPAVKILRELGATVSTVKFSPLDEALIQILNVESASAFDEFTRGDQIDGLKNSLWPEIFRAARFVPAVEYLQAQRARTLLMHRFEEEFGDLDMFLCVDGGSTLADTNLTGHPQIVIPWGDDGKGNSRARCLVGRLYREDTIIAVANAIQDRAGFLNLRPDLSVF